MSKPHGLATRLKAKDDAKKRKETLVKTAVFGIPMAIVLVAIVMAFFSDGIELDASDSLRAPSGWMKDVATTKRRGDSYYSAEQYDVAIEYYKSALRSVRTHDAEKITTKDETKLMRAYLSNSLALSYGHLGNTTQAESWYEKGLSVDSEHLELLYNYANHLAETKRWLHAEKHYRKAIALKPDFDLAMMGLAFVLQQHEAWDEARTLLFTAWEIAKDKDVAAQLGWLYLSERNADRALEWLSIAADLGHVGARQQRDELLLVWQKTRESMHKASDQGDTIELGSSQ
ncbi:hypothetical protein SDRG_10890 [Saprolegnia diclina VS20]|uniref:Tetratricopeptide repeat protein n=1 Tax=Saprolegnia diclina (strain VS20) TaxID=1156394 RepID=T0RMT6_SAPDV|nr:hypothetical protein SDRG_10890 [Saprolegnia diclina VS20]EQC31287.1 hypothetical protein SDRG_10890 [Saprolegnia diclina VS20]|eukprot:XP_008615128.1 hypothetical protein SDRG_10890 [Saprolegnia diclina VS20]